MCVLIDATSFLVKVSVCIRYMILFVSLAEVYNNSDYWCMIFITMK